MGIIRSLQGVVGEPGALVEKGVNNKYDLKSNLKVHT